MTQDPGSADQQQQYVHVTLDEHRPTASVRLLGSWRREIGAGGLGAATLLALASAMHARMLAVLAAGPPPAPVPSDIVLPATRRGRDDLLRRAIRELDEFRVALTALSATEEAVQDPARHVTVTIRQNAIARIDVDSAWVDRTRDTAVEHALSSALSKALTRIAVAPARALSGCPDLQSVLQMSGSPLATDPGGAVR